MVKPLEVRFEPSMVSKNVSSTSMPKGSNIAREYENNSQRAANISSNSPLAFRKVISTSTIPIQVSELQKPVGIETT